MEGKNYVVPIFILNKILFINFIILLCPKQGKHIYFSTYLKLTVHL